VRGIRNCSGQSNRYHNAAFRALAEELGMWFPMTEAHPTRGYTDVELTDATLVELTPVIDALDVELSLRIEPPALVEGGPPGGDGGPVATGERPKSDRNNMRFECSCDPPRVMRMAPTTWEAGDVLCGACECRFE
jgi:hypothetical protein